MGILDIRYRSERRGNLGDLPTYRTDTGAAEAWRAAARLGRDITDAAGGLGRAVVGFAKEAEAQREREEERLVASAVEARQRGLAGIDDASARAVIGDGDGAEGKWLEDTLNKRTEFDRHLQEERGLTDEQMGKVRSRMVGSDLTMERSWRRRAEGAGAARQLGTATRSMEAFNETCASPDASSEAWRDWVSANEALVAAYERRDGRAYTAEERRGIYAANARVVYGKMAALQAAKVARDAEAAEDEGLEGGGESVFDEAIVTAEYGGAENPDDLASFLPASTFVTDARRGRRLNAMAEALRGGGVDLAALKAEHVGRLRAAKDAWLKERIRKQGETAAAADAQLDRMQWGMAYDLSGAGGKFDPAKAAAFRFPGEETFAGDIGEAVAKNRISHAQGTALLGRFNRLVEARERLAYDTQHPEQFAQQSDMDAWVAVKKAIANAGRDRTPAEQIERAVEAVKGKLTAKDYFALWHDARKMRDAEDDRIANQVLSRFLEVSEKTVALGTDRGRRGEERAKEAVATLLGSGKAEYVRSWRINNPDFTIEDVDEAKALLVDHLRTRPGDMDGAAKLLDWIVNPSEKKALSMAWRDRIIQIRRDARRHGGGFDVMRAFGGRGGGAGAAKGTDKKDKKEGKEE